MNVPSYLLALAVVGTGILALGPRHMGNPTGATTRTDVSSVARTSAAVTAGTNVDTKAFAYLPREIAVAVGSTVRFTNSDAVAHSISADDGSFDSKNVAGGSTWSHVFAKAGTFAYSCAYHRSMKGKVVVR